jgi:hypothetical protein
MVAVLNGLPKPPWKAWQMVKASLLVEPSVWGAEHLPADGLGVERSA